ncbi:Rqc2 family fibronectin-binding protein [Alkalihalobacterium chitinilyticum]|uniref:Rqc2 homolog RqcH n=1 Tax=Alkalihalobacterium chitinilyticum TaxID=2980103 RepID=A0ABT5VCG2_9BACI|nr:NFACT RNA binding domain-containing protein [Alkalihalobacterium chitinilyticum]MDE5413027.1 NFACT family protein [Alkalihalobacterium chitinilyticum]
MSFDGLMTRAITNELQEKLVTGRISRVYQPYKTELLLTIRAKGTNHSLLLSANPSFARAHLTKEKYDNPQEPPMFCMLLRKHLEGSFIEKIEQIDMERIITIDIKGKDELGDTTYKTLVIEIMGRHSNITLIDKESKKIIDSIKHITPSQSSVRTVLPGHTYEYPPGQGKTDPFSVDEEGLLRKLDFNQGKLDKQLLEAFSGISPQVTKEIVHRAKLSQQKAVVSGFFEVIDPLKANQFEPQMIIATGKEAFSLFSLTHLHGDVRYFSSVSELLDRFFYGKGERDRVKQQAHDLERFLRNELSKNEKKIKKLEKTLVDAEKAQKYQRFGELLTANLYMVKRGDKAVDVIDYYDVNGATVTIPLDPQKTPSDNAQNFFRKYNKAKNSVAVVEEQIEKAKQEIKYLDQLIQQMEAASPKDVEEIREELVEEGYVRRRQKDSKKKKKPTKPQVESYISSAGVEFFVGKNNKQNEYLTNRFARQDEIWLHTKDIPGSHVLIRDTNPDETTLTEAATVAAFYSKARQSSGVPVDYTKIRHVKKPSGSKPGFVIYDNQTTLYVTPDEDLVLKLRK